MSIRLHRGRDREEGEGEFCKLEQSETRKAHTVQVLPEPWPALPVSAAHRHWHSAGFPVTAVPEVQMLGMCQHVHLSLCGAPLVKTNKSVSTLFFT